MCFEWTADLINNMERMSAVNTVQRTRDVSIIYYSLARSIFKRWTQLIVDLDRHIWIYSLQSTLFETITLTLCTTNESFRKKQNTCVSCRCGRILKVYSPFWPWNGPLMNRSLLLSFHLCQWGYDRISCIREFIIIILQKHFDFFLSTWHSRTEIAIQFDGREDENRRTVLLISDEWFRNVKCVMCISAVLILDHIISSEMDLIHIQNSDSQPTLDVTQCSCIILATKPEINLIPK